MSRRLRSIWLSTPFVRCRYVFVSSISSLALLLTIAQFSKIPGFMKRESDIDGCIHTLDTALSIRTIGGVFPNWHSAFMQLVQILRLPSPLTRHLGKWVDEQIELRRQQKANGDFNSASSDIVSTMLGAAEDSSSSSSRRITDAEVKLTALVNVLAGSDTTSIALTSILFHLYRNPRYLQRLRQELETTPENITFQEAQKLPFLQAVIREGMRVFPSVALPMLRVVPAQGCTIAGVEFPAGVSYIWNNQTAC